MGVFDVHCSYSGVALIGEVQFLLLEGDHNNWRVLSAPFRGCYDRYGRIDLPSADDGASGAQLDAFVAWGHEVSGVSEFEEILEKMLEGQALWRGHRISYTLVDGGVYDALPSVLSEADPNLPEHLQCAWKAALGAIAPIDIEDSDQYCGFEGEYGCRSRTDAAQIRFANDPGISAAIEANASQWRELDMEG